MNFFDNFQANHLIAAHRGFRGHYPENSFAAFKASVGRCHFIELDIQMSKDLVPVVFHDPSLERTSDGLYKSKDLGIDSLKIADWTLAHLKQLDIGAWFLENDPFGTIKSGEISPHQLKQGLPQRIMTLEEVLLQPELAPLPINVEIKDHSGSKQHSEVTSRILEVIKGTGASGRVLLSSFNHDYLVQAKCYAPEISTAALSEKNDQEDLIEYLRSLGVVAFHPADSICNASLVKRVSKANIAVNVFTVNSSKRQQALFNMGVTAIFTDFPTLD